VVNNRTFTQYIRNLTELKKQLNTLPNRRTQQYLIKSNKNLTKAVYKNNKWSYNKCLLAMGSGVFVCSTILS
jgi:hypothetical protein